MMFPRVHFSGTYLKEMNKIKDVFEDNLLNKCEQRFQSDDKIVQKSIGEKYPTCRNCVMTSCLKIAVFYFAGILFFTHVERWDITTCVYFITQTLSTVGYGNIAPATHAGRNFCIFYMVAGLLLIFSVVGDATHSLGSFIQLRNTKFVKRSRVDILLRAVIGAAMWLCLLLLVVLFGAVVISLSEGWSLHTAFYFCAVTATTIGFGDLALHNSFSVWFNVLFILASVSTTAIALKKVGNLRQQVAEAEQEQQLHNIPLTQELLQAISKERLSVTPSEYILHMLQLSGKLHPSDVEPWLSRFGELDRDRDGLLSMSDVEAHTQCMQREEFDKKHDKNVRRDGGMKNIFSDLVEETISVFRETFQICLSGAQDTDSHARSPTHSNATSHQHSEVTSDSIDLSAAWDDEESGLLLTNSSSSSSGVSGSKARRSSPQMCLSSHNSSGNKLL